MATFTVTTTADVVNAGDGVLSLREAVTQANATTEADTIVFAAGLETQTLTLTGGELVIGRDLTIDGDQNNDGLEVVLSGGGTQRLLRTSGAGTDLTLQDLTLVDGHVFGDADGGAVYVGGGGSISATGITVSNSQTEYGSGGGIFVANGSRLSIENSSVVQNDAGAYLATGIHLGSGSAAVIRNSVISDNGYYLSCALKISDGANLVIEDSTLGENRGGAIGIYGGSADILRCTIADNVSLRGGGIFIRDGNLTVTDSTVSNNRADTLDNGYDSLGGGLYAGGSSFVVIRNTTMTSNTASGRYDFDARGGGIYADSGVRLDIVNSIVAGNVVLLEGGGIAQGPDIFGTINISNGHNIFGSDVAGNVSGDRESVAASAIFAAIDPETGGGLLHASGIVLLRSSVANPALSGADPLAASATGQLGGTGRPLPAGSLPDLGSIEINQPLSTTASANNDVLTGTAAANTISGLAGADFIKGLGGNDTLRGGDGGDLLDGGAGNDRLYGDGGIDLVFYGGSTKVTVDLSLATDKATRGSEVDTLYNVEGAIGSSAADTFKGNEYNNYFQGGLGKDTATGGGGRDLYDFNAVADSTVGATTRDVITDFAHLVDRIDLMGIDADTGVAGNQAFRWAGTSALTGPGEVGYFSSGGTTIIRASTDADAASEFEIQLTGLKTLTAVDFYL